MHRFELYRNDSDLYIEVDLPVKRLPSGMVRCRITVPISALGLTGSHDVDGHILSEFITKGIAAIVSMKDSYP